MPADKPGVEWSFAIGSKYGPRSAKWQVFVRGNDVYVNTAAQSGDWHASLHEGGQWHIKETSRDRSRIITQSHEALVPAGHYAIGLNICIPESCLRRASDVDKASDPRRLA